jgi:hypothetical protein
MLILLLFIFVISTFLSFRFSSLNERSYMIKENYNSEPVYGILTRDVNVKENINVGGLVIALGLIASSSLIGFVFVYIKDNGDKDNISD